MATPTPTFIKRGIDSDDVLIDDPIEIITPGVVKPGIEIETAAPANTAALTFEQFMAEVVEVTFSEPTDDNAPQFVEVTVNGDYRCIPRDGEIHRLKRYHLAVLAQAKQGRVRQKKIVNSDGSMGYQDENVLALSYPFQVVVDPSGRRGSEWLRSILRAPC